MIMKMRKQKELQSQQANTQHKGEHDPRFQPIRNMLFPKQGRIDVIILNKFFLAWKKKASIISKNIQKESNDEIPASIWLAMLSTLMLWGATCVGIFKRTNAQVKCQHLSCRLRLPYHSFRLFIFTFTQLRTLIYNIVVPVRFFYSFLYQAPSLIVFTEKFLFRFGMSITDIRVFYISCNFVPQKIFVKSWKLWVEVLNSVNILQCTGWLHKTRTYMTPDFKCIG